MVITRTEEKLTFEEQDNRFNRCVANPFEFFKYVKIKDASTQQIIPFEMWPHLKLILLALRDHRQVVLLKPKQIGGSWLAAGYHDWLCYRPATNVLCFSKGEDEAAELVDKSRFINTCLPDWLRNRTPPHDAGSRSPMLFFPDTHSRIRALPSTEDAGVGETATHVTRDELDFHKFAEENFAHVKPTVDAPGGASILDMSTSKRSKPMSHFKTLYQRAKAGENNYFPIFLPWYVRADRTREWYIQTRRDYFPLWLFEQDYPTTEEEALGAIEGEGLFERDALQRLLMMCREPKETRVGQTFIFHRPKPTVRYYAGGDAAEGRGGDYSVLWIEGAAGQDRELCTIMRTNRMTPDIFAFHAHQLLAEYGRPLLVMGNDAWGQMVLDALAAMGYRDRIHCSDQKGEKLGYTELGKKNEQMDLMNFAVAVRDGLTIRYKPAIQEMFSWALENGKYVSNATHDDCVTAGAMATVAYELADISGEVEAQRFF